MVGDEAGAVEPLLRAKELGLGTGHREPGSGFEHTIDCVMQTLKWNHCSLKVREISRHEVVAVYCKLSR